MKFTKMHGCGNDYVYVNCFEETVENPSAVARYVSDRHFGIGSDGLILIKPSKIADCEMDMYNLDGSQGAMCGNGIRCVGKYVYDKGYTDKTHLKIDTLSGIKYLDLQLSGGKVRSVTVDMGKAVAGEDMTIDADGQTVTCTPVSVGNPHAVIFVDDIELAPLTTLGPVIEHHEAFPGGVNVEFVQVLSENELRMRVWERGSGVTMACGTGACAAVVAAVANGLCEKGRDITVRVQGGDLVVHYTDEAVTLTGDAKLVYTGVVEY